MRLSRKIRREQARESVRAERRESRARPLPRKLSEEIAALRERFSVGPLTLGDVVGTLQGRAWTLVLILLALPFVTPIPLPFLSTPFGLAIGLIALRLVLGQKPWLPQRLMERALPPGFFGSVLKFSGGLLRFLEKGLRPRLVWVTETPLLARLHALLMVGAAVVLLLPLPVPFTNAFPAWVVLLIAGGLLERDGGAILAGYTVAGGGVAFFYYLGEAVVRLAEVLKTWVIGWW